jgi:hypothetical protein
VRIGVIGGGAAGLATAWLLQDDHQVTLLEKENRLGGHANTVEVEINGSTVPVESGFEFFSEEVYPCFARLLRALEVPLGRYRVTSRLPDSGGVHLLPLVRTAIEWSAFQPHSLSYVAVRICPAVRHCWSKRVAPLLSATLSSVRISGPSAIASCRLDGGWCLPIEEFRRLRLTTC